MGMPSETASVSSEEKRRIYMIDLDRVSKSYNRGQPAVDAVSLHVDKGI